MKKSKEFKLIECQGTPYEIGRQWGEGCKESILKVSENLGQAMSSYYQASREEVVSQGDEVFPLGAKV
jgi:isopenicillin-N N-acyltransferase-like protein